MALSDIVQKSKNQSSLLNRRGQAVVEYVLLLVVTVSILLALVYQLFKPFQSFVKSYMGDYTACLLETGELPSLGNADSQALLSDEGCDAKFDAATLASGRPPKTSSGSSSPINPPPPQNSPDTNSGGKSGGGNPPAASSSSSNNNLLIASMKPKTGTESGDGLSDKVTEIPLAAGSKFYNRKDSYSQDFTVRNGKQIVVPLNGIPDEEKKKQERKEGNRRTVASGDDLSGPSKKTAVKPPPPKPVVEDDSPLTFGNFFRFLLIAAIVIAIVVVLGSQALKIAKSQEK